MAVNTKLSTTSRIEFLHEWEPKANICLSQIMEYDLPDGWYCKTWGVVLWI